MVDVTVHGAGIFGLSIAWSCIQQGAKVQVIDPRGVGAGASGGIVGALAPHTPENWNDKKAFQFESLIMAEAFWREVEAAGGQSSGYTRSGRLQPVIDDRGLDLAKKRAENAKLLWEGKAAWNVVPQEGTEAWRPQSATGYFVHDTLSARLHPRMASRALGAAITASGGKIVQDAAPKGLSIWATGWEGLRDLSEKLGKSIGNGVKGQAILVALDRANAPQLFADTVHIVPHSDGTVAIGSTSEREFDDPRQTDSQLDALWQRACAAVPELLTAPIIERWAGVRPRAKSRAPMLGEHPLRPGEFIANGGFKIGFGMAPKVGSVMAELILNGRDFIPDDFRVEASL